MPMRVALEYYEAITMIEARDNLVKMSIQDFPNLKPDARAKSHKQMSKLAYPNSEEKTLKFSDFAKEAGSILSGR